MYKVIKAFIDKETMQEKVINSAYTPSSPKRAKELVEKGFIVEEKNPGK